MDAILLGDHVLANFEAAAFALVVQDEKQPFLALLMALHLDNLLAGHNGPPPEPPRTPTSEAEFEQRLIHAEALRRYFQRTLEKTEIAAGKKLVVAG